MFRDIESETIVCRYCIYTQNEIDGNFTILCNCRNNRTFIHESCVRKFIHYNGNYCEICETYYNITLYESLIEKVKQISFFLKVKLF